MAEILSLDPNSPEPGPLARAAALIRAGEVVAFPTDTLYGLAADPFNPSAVEKVFAAKGRSPDAPLLLLVDSLEMAAACTARLPPLFRALATRFWPGPLTIVVDASPKLPPALTANTGRVGLRWPAAAVALALVHAVGGPITATSANRTGAGDCRTAQEVESAIGDRLPLILDGGTSPSTLPSTVIALRDDSWELIREGAIPREVLADFLARRARLDS